MTRVVGSAPETDEGNPPEFRRLRLRFPGKCGECGVELSKGADAWYDRSRKKVICLACAPGDVASDETAGKSALAEGERRRERVVEQVRKEHGDYAAAVAEQLTANEVAASWGKGSEGESRLASFIGREVGDAVIALHDRVIPGSRANIDHIWVAPTGVWVVDAKAYRGKVVRREVGPIWRRDNEVLVGRHDRTKLAKGVVRQVEAVRAALRLDPELRGTDLYGALCFLDSEWGLLDFPFQVGYVWVMYPGALRKRLKKSGPLTRERMERVARRLDLSLPRAA
jgi:hypothetical protein